MSPHLLAEEGSLRPGGRRGLFVGSLLLEGILFNVPCQLYLAYLVFFRGTPIQSRGGMSQTDLCCLVLLVCGKGYITFCWMGLHSTTCCCFPPVLGSQIIVPSAAYLSQLSLIASCVISTAYCCTLLGEHESMPPHLN